LLLDGGAAVQVPVSIVTRCPAWTNMEGSFTPAPAIPAACSKRLIVLASFTLVPGAGLIMLRRREAPHRV
jgi:hypothetical protein